MNDVITVIVCIALAAFLGTLKGDHTGYISILTAMAVKAYANYNTTKTLSDKADATQASVNGLLTKRVDDAATIAHAQGVTDTINIQKEMAASTPAIAVSQEGKG